MNFDLHCLKTERLHLEVFMPISEIGDRWERLTNAINELEMDALEEHWLTREPCWMNVNRFCDDGTDVSTGARCTHCEGAGEITRWQVASHKRNFAQALFNDRHFCIVCWADPCKGACGTTLQEAA